MGMMGRLFSPHPMSTRATVSVFDAEDRFDVYQHYDGYPDGENGLVARIDASRTLAWPLPRFEAMDFAAALVAVLKERPGGTYLTRSAQWHGDRDYHYDVTAEGNRLVVEISGFTGRNVSKVLFRGSIEEAVAEYRGDVDRVVAGTPGAVGRER